MANFAATAAHLAAANHKPVPAIYERKLSQHSRSAATIARPKTAPSTTSNPQPNGTLANASSKAALLAHGARQKETQRTIPSPTIPPRTSSTQQKALMAATKSFGGQKPAQSKPVGTPLTAKEAHLAQRRIQARQQESTERRNTPIIKIAPEMLTEHPPIRMEREEKQHREKLHASAVALAQQTYAKQQSNPTRSLHGTAQQLADEKLAKLQKAHDDSNLRAYYGVPPVRRSKSLHVLGRSKSKREHTPLDDIEQSNNIRSQMSILQAQIAHVDASQRDQDRQKLLDAAKRKVHTDMQKMDQAVFKETGKMSPAMMQDWDTKARERLRERRASAHARPDDAIDIGGGRLLHRIEIDNLAESRVKPTLAGIDEAVAKRHAEDAERREELEEKRRETEKEKEKKREEKAERKQLHAEERAERKQHHAEEKAEKKRIHDIGKAEREEKKQQDGHVSKFSIRRVRNSVDQPERNYDENPRSSGAWKRLSIRHPGRASTTIERSVEEETTVEHYDNQINNLQSTPPKKKSVWKRFSRVRSSSPDPVEVETKESKTSRRPISFISFGRKQDNPTDSTQQPKRNSIISMPSSFQRSNRQSTDLQSTSTTRQNTHQGPIRNALTKLTGRSNPSTSSLSINSFDPPTNRLIISAPIPGSLERHTTTSSSISPPSSIDNGGGRAIGTSVMGFGQQSRRKDKLAGNHMDSKFHEEIV